MEKANKMRGPEPAQGSAIQSGGLQVFMGVSDAYNPESGGGTLDSPHAYNGEPDQRAMILRDPQVRSEMGKRLSAIASLDWDIVTGETASPELRADVVNVISGMTGLVAAWRALLNDAVIFGYKIAEVEWAERSGRIVPIRIKPRPSRWYSFDNDGCLCYVADNKRTRLDEQGDYYGVYFVISSDERDGDRRGCGLADSLWYPVWGIAENVKLWLINNDKYSHPTLDASTDEKNDQKRQHLADRLKRHTTQGVIVHGKDTEVKYLEANHQNTAAAFEGLTKMLKADISKMIIGQNMTSGDVANGGRGSYALAKTGALVERNIVLGDATLIADAMTQLVRAYVTLNHSAELAYDLEFCFDLETEQVTTRERALILQSLASAGVRVETSAAAFRETFSLPAPTGPDDVVWIGNAKAAPQPVADGTTEPESEGDDA